MTQDDTTFLPLQRVLDTEGTPDSWQSFESPEEFLKYISDHFAVDPARLDDLQRFQITDTQPDLDTVWINTTNVPFVGIPIEGVFVKFYRYPPNVPFISVLASDVTQPGLRVVTVAEKEAWGLPEVTGTGVWMVLDIDLPAIT